MAFLKKEIQTTVLRAEKKSSTKLIAFVGTEKGIVPYHLAIMLMKTNPNAEILLLDNSMRGDIYKCIPRYKNYAGSFGTTTVLRNRSYSPEAFSKFDYVIVYMGYGYDQEYVDVADTVFVLSDYTVMSKDFLMKVSIKEDAKNRVIFLDKITPKITERFMLNGTSLEETQGIEIIDSEEEDLRGYIEWMYNGEHAISCMSRIYQDVISIMTATVTELDVKTIAKIR